MKKLSDLSNVDNLSVKDLFQIRGGASAAEPGCTSKNCTQIACNSVSCTSASCTTLSCNTRSCSTKSVAVIDL